MTNVSGVTVVSDEADRAAAAAAQKSADTRSEALKQSSEAAAVEVTTLFVTEDSGILMQDSFPLEPPLGALLALQVQHTLLQRDLQRTIAVTSILFHNVICRCDYEMKS